jgi:hypothetical protein
MKNLFFYLVLFFSFTVKAQTLTAGNFKVDALSTANHRMDYSYDISGTFFKVDMYVYKNSVAQENLISYNSKIDESNFEQFTFPPGFRYSTYSLNYYESTTPAKFILVIEAWENPEMPKMTQTLTYTPPAPQKPDFSIARIQIYRDKFNTNDYSHLFFDSQDTANYPGTAFNKGTKYKFVVTVYNTGSLTSQNSTLTLIQGLSQSGTYPSGTALKTYDAAVSIANTNIKTVEFYETLISPSQDYVPAYLAFHIDKNNTADELNENNNIKIQQASLYPTSITIPGKSANLTSIKVFNEKGNLLKEYSVKKDEKIENKIVEDFGAGNYFIKSENNITRRLKISK